MTQRRAGWALLIGLAVTPIWAQDAFHGCTGNGWDCKAQSKHPEVFNRPLLLPALEGPYRVVAHTPLDPKTCQAHLAEVKEKGVALLPEFPQVPVTAVSAPGLTGWAVRTGEVDEVWLCTGGNQVVLVPWGPQGDQVRLAQAVPGALDPPLPPLDPPTPDLGEMAVAAASSELTIVCQDGSRWSDVHSAEACAARGGVSAWIVSEAPSTLTDEAAIPAVEPADASISEPVVAPPAPSPSTSSPLPQDEP